MWMWLSRILSCPWCRFELFRLNLVKCRFRWSSYPSHFLDIKFFRFCQNWWIVSSVNSCYSNDYLPRKKYILVKNLPECKRKLFKSVPLWNCLSLRHKWEKSLVTLCMSKKKRKCAKMHTKTHVSYNHGDWTLDSVPLVEAAKFLAQL